MYYCGLNLVLLIKQPDWFVQYCQVPTELRQLLPVHNNEQPSREMKIHAVLSKSIQTNS